MDIWGLPLEVGKRLVLTEKKYTPNSTNFHSITLIEGWSREFNCIYGRVLHGQEIGTSIQGVPGWGAVCIRHSDLDGFRVEVK